MLDNLDLTTLRAERRRLTDEHARLTWLRRLVKARGDLEVARLAGVSVAGSHVAPLTPAVRTALALDADPDLVGPDLLVELARSARSLAVAADDTHRDLQQTTAELVRRYAQDPTRCLAASAS